MEDTLQQRLNEAHRFWIFMKDHEIEPVEGQHMFPNCKIRYNKCCTTDEEFWAKLDAKVKEMKPEKQSFRSLEAFNTKERYVWNGKS